MRAKKAPLLSDAEMARLYEEIFDEPVSAEALFAKLYELPLPQRGCAEWVMDERTWNRIRREHLAASFAGFVSMKNFEAMRASLPNDTLLGLPIVIEPFAKLSLRCRFGKDHGDGE